MNESIKLLNSLLKFKEQNNLQDECILDIIQDYCHHYNMSLDEFIDVMGDYNAFKEYVNKDLIKHKYIKSDEEILSDKINDILSEWI